MSNFKYVPKKEYLPVKKELINLINLVQNEVREYFTFSFEFIGSASRNMITRDESSNVGYDFDVNIMVNDNDNVYSAKEIKQILMKVGTHYSRRLSLMEIRQMKILQTSIRKLLLLILYLRY